MTKISAYSDKNVPLKSEDEVNYTICTVVECKYGYRQSLLRIFDNIVSFPDKGNSPYVYS